jgi:NADH:ubiquinone oxidoreductase subunit 6 (subunit J)
MDSNLAAQSIFYLLAIVTVGSAAVVVFSRSLIYSAFGLLFTFFGVAGLYVFLGADFLAATQMVIYVGGILVLLLFGVMLTHKLYDLDLKTETFQFLPAMALIIVVFAMIATVALKTTWFQHSPRPLNPTTAEIGELFMNDFILPFEISSVLLLVALMGAAMIVRRKSE